MNMNKKILIFIFLIFPIVVSAQINTFKDLLTAIMSLIALLIPLAYGLALLFFLWGIAKFIFKAGDEKAKEDGKRLMVWGVIALFVITSIWGIIAVFRYDLLGIPTRNMISPPGPSPIIPTQNA